MFYTIWIGRDGEEWRQSIPSMYLTLFIGSYVIFKTCSNLVWFSLLFEWIKTISMLPKYHINVIIKLNRRKGHLNNITENQIGSVNK